MTTALFFFFNSSNHFLVKKKKKPKKNNWHNHFNIVFSQLSVQLKRSLPCHNNTRAVLVCGVWTPVIGVIVSLILVPSVWERRCCTLDSLRFQIKPQETHTRTHTLAFVRTQVGPHLQNHLTQSSHINELHLQKQIVLMLLFWGQKQPLHVKYYFNIAPARFP